MTPPLVTKGTECLMFPALYALQHRVDVKTVEDIECPVPHLLDLPNIEERTPVAYWFNQEERHGTFCLCLTAEGLEVAKRLHSSLIAALMGNHPDEWTLCQRLLHVLGRQQHMLYNGDIQELIDNQMVSWYRNALGHPKLKLSDWGVERLLRIVTLGLLMVDHIKLAEN